MKNIVSLLFLTFLVFISSLKSQQSQQFFDGNDTINSIIIDFGNDTISNTWQIGEPEKSIFDTAATTPNVIITDTVNYYPNNDSSSFMIHFNKEDFNWDDWGSGVFAFQWQQKLNFDKLYDGGLLEFSVDTGITWHNIFNNPYSYNLYGYDENNVDTLTNGVSVFTGTDNVWRNVWICFDYSWLYQEETLDFRFTIISDSINNNKEGWMIDNFLAHTTMIHTLIEIEQDEYVKVYPNPSKDRLNINLKRQKDFHIIEKMQVLSSMGKVIEEFRNIPTKFFIDIKNYENGTYFLKIQTNIKTETVKFNVEH